MYFHCCLCRYVKINFQHTKLPFKNYNNWNLLTVKITGFLGFLALKFWKSWNINKCALLKNTKASNIHILKINKDILETPTILTKESYILAQNQNKFPITYIWR